MLSELNLPACSLHAKIFATYVSTDSISTSSPTQMSKLPVQEKTAPIQMHLTIQLTLTFTSIYQIRE